MDIYSPMSSSKLISSKTKINNNNVKINSLNKSNRLKNLIQKIIIKTPSSITISSNNNCSINKQQQQKQENYQQIIKKQTLTKPTLKSIIMSSKTQLLDEEESFKSLALSLLSISKELNWYKLNELDYYYQLLGNFKEFFFIIK